MIKLKAGAWIFEIYIFLLSSTIVFKMIRLRSRISSALSRLSHEQLSCSRSTLVSTPLALRIQRPLSTSNDHRDLNYTAPKLLDRDFPGRDKIEREVAIETKVSTLSTISIVNVILFYITTVLMLYKRALSPFIMVLLFPKFYYYLVLVLEITWCEPHRSPRRHR